MTINADIDRIFKEGLNNYSPKAPDYIWGQVDLSLSNRKRRVKRTLVFSAAASVAILIAFGAGFLFTNSDNQNPVINNNQMVAVDSTLNNDQVAEPAQPESNKEISESEDVKNVNMPDKPENHQNKTIKVEQSKPKSIRVKSAGSLLAPVYSDSAVMPVDTLAKPDSSNLNQ
jgi:hypothetical protein